MTFRDKDTWADIFYFSDRFYIQINVCRVTTCVNFRRESNSILFFIFHGHLCTQINKTIQKINTKMKYTACSIHFFQIPSERVRKIGVFSDILRSVKKVITLSTYIQLHYFLQGDLHKSKQVIIIIFSKCVEHTVNRKRNLLVQCQFTHCAQNSFTVLNMERKCLAKNVITIFY